MVGCAADQVADVPELVRIVDWPVQDVLVVGVVACLGFRDGLGHRRQEIVVHTGLSDHAWTSPSMMLWNVLFSDIGELPPHETGAAT
jgi:hypothetical protein